MTKKIIWFAGLFLLLNAACNKEDDLVASDKNIASMFTPDENAAPEVKEFYNKYGIWLRTECNSLKELANAIIAEDGFLAARGDYENLEATAKPEVYEYVKVLMGNVSDKFAKEYFPLEFFFLKSCKTYVAQNFLSIGRSRLIVCWPNQTTGCIPVMNAKEHYFQDSVLTTNVWSRLVGMITARMENDLIPEFVAAGTAYDAAAVDEIYNEYYETYDVEKWQKDMDALAAGGFITGDGSSDFRSDFSEWLQLLVTESYDNIKRDYLDNNTFRANKYKILVKWLKDNYDWDIQAAGNEFRRKYDEYKATLPTLAEDDEEQVNEE